MGKRKLFYFASAGFLAGLLAGGALVRYFWPSSQNDESGYNLRSAAEKFVLIHPLLASRAGDGESSGEFKPLQRKLARLALDETAGGRAGTVAIYFRDLETGRWTGFGEDEKFSPASMLKVPIMMAVLKLAESRPEFLSQKIRYDGFFDRNQTEIIKSSQTLRPGAEYDVKQLVRAMILYSDNNAAQLLSDHARPGSLFDVFREVGISLPATNAQTADFMSPKLYSIFFRILYNATYLNREMSEEALKLLAKSDFSQGIRAPLPPDVVVAEKFGERSIPAPADGGQSIAELHDCGIVYYPGRPYFLCVMTQGGNFENLERIIQDVSRLVYGEAQNFLGG